MTLSREDLDEVACELEAALEAEAAVRWRPRYNVAPTDAHPMLRLDSGGRRLLACGTWGFSRSGPPGRTKAAPLVINARAETAAERTSFRSAWAARRCVVPADGFYEWTGGGAERRPLWFHRPDGRLLLIAGLYEELRGSVTPRTEAVGASGPAPRWRFVVLTTTANRLVAQVHDRMPALLSPDEAAAWLHAPAVELLRPAPDEALVATPASRRANSVRNDDPGLLNADGDASDGEAAKAEGVDGPAAQRGRQLRLL